MRRTAFSPSCSIGLLMANAVNFPPPESVFIFCLHLWKTFALDVGIWVVSAFLSLLFYFFLASLVFDRKSVVTGIFVPRCVMCHFLPPGHESKTDDAGLPPPLCCLPLPSLSSLSYSICVYTFQSPWMVLFSFGLVLARFLNLDQSLWL